MDWPSAAVCASIAAMAIAEWRSSRGEDTRHRVTRLEAESDGRLERLEAVERRLDAVNERIDAVAQGGEP